MESSGSSSAFVLSAVGSLEAVTLRLASASRTDKGGETNETRTWVERFEVVSLVGTFAPSNQKHLHLSVANAKGDCIGGHLMAGKVFTTLELIIGTIENVQFSREADEQTGYTELAIRSKSQPDV